MSKAVTEVNRYIPGSQDNSLPLYNSFLNCEVNYRHPRYILGSHFGYIVYI